MLPTCAVICRAFEPDGSPAVGTIFTAHLNKSVIYNGVVLSDDVVATTDAEGVATLNLWPNALSTENTYYAIRIDTAGHSATTGNIYVPNVASVELHTIATLNVTGSPLPAPVVVNGPKGDRGVQGEKGIQGVTGNTGPAGPKGSVGPKGDVGATGAQGMRGEIGIPGERGRAGLFGSDGLDGQQGREGPMGPPGPKGATGPRGEVITVDGMTVTGPQGLRGQQGPRGYTGDRGLMGATGVQGEPGLDTRTALEAMYSDQGHLMTTVTAALSAILS